MTSTTGGPTARPLRVFLCHARDDKPAVRDLYQRLMNDGFLPWLDEEDLIPGQDWQAEIPKAVRNCDLVVVCLSSHAANKEGYIQKEIRFALDAADEKPEGTIYLIPLKLEECPVPERLSRWPWVDFFHPDGYRRLLKALRFRAESLGLSLAPPAPAPSIAVLPGTVRVNPQDGLEYVWIPPGEFTMGATVGDDQAFSREKPAHRVRITRGFWMGKTPVTVAAYKRFAEATRRAMPPPPDFNAKWKRDDHPIVNVSWDDARAYCEWAGGRLPTEAEWEYAARGGKEGLVYPWGDQISPDRANYDGKNGGTTPVLKYLAQNEWGLHDLSGNVWEWVADWYDEKYYSTLPLDRAIEDPRGPAKGQYRTLRGGSWDYDSWVLRAVYRYGDEPEYRYGSIGFRCTREVISP